MDILHHQSGSESFRVGMFSGQTRHFHKLGEKRFAHLLCSVQIKLFCSLPA